MDFVDAIRLRKLPTPFAIENGPKEQRRIHEECRNEGDAEKKEQILWVLCAMSNRYVGIEHWWATLVGRTRQHNPTSNRPATPHRAAPHTRVHAAKRTSVSSCFNQT